MTEIYSPAEDSYLLSETLKKEIKNKDIIFLEIGIGSGIQLKTAKEIGIKKILGVDVNPKAVKYCSSLGFECIESDLFQNIKGKYDLIIFNPPYLPENKYDKGIDTTGGKKGGEIINKFLKQAKKHLNENGRIFLLTSSLTKGINWLGYKKKLLSKKKIFFEELYVWELS